MKKVPNPGTKAVPLMRVISKATLRSFWEKHADSEQSLKSWYKEASEAAWTSPRDIKAAYVTTCILPNNRVVLNIKGNHYRLIVKINYGYGMVWVRFVGTHREYDAVNANTI